MKKILTLLTLLLCAVTGVWADDTTLFSTDFTESGWSSLNSTSTAQTLTIGTQTVYVRANKTDNLLSVNTTTGTLTWGNRNFSNKDCYMAIPITGVNGSVTVKVYDGTNKTRVTYATSTSSTVANPSSTTDASSASPATFTVSNITGSFIMVYLGRQGSGTKTATSITITTPAPEKEIVSQEFAGVKVNGSEIATPAKYGVDGTTITLTDSYVSAPTIALINHITYDDDSTENEDVTVTLGAAGATYSGFFSGTATIGETTYTVKVPVDVTPTLAATAASITVTSPKLATGSQTFTVIGANLTGENVTLAFASDVDGLTISPASIPVVDGAVNQEVTVSYKSTVDVSANSVNLTISSDGVSSIVIPVNYSSTAGITAIEAVSGITTWDWSNTGQSSTVVSPDENNIIVFANTDGWGAAFNANAIAGKAKQFYASKSAYKYCQGHVLKIVTDVPGTVSIDFSNTGSKSDYRWLAVNGVVTSYKSKDETKVEAVDIPVAAGEVLIEAVQGTSSETAPEYTAANTMFNFRKVVFTPTATVTTNKGKWASFTPSWNVKLASGAQAYIITAVSETSVTASTVDVLSAGTGYFVKGAAAETAYTATATADDATATAGNKIVGTTTDITINGEGNTKYVLGTAGEVSGLFKVDSEVTVAVGKAYLDAGTVLSARQLSLNFDESTTGITTVEEQKGLLDGDFYNVAGQRVAQPTKGLYIVNGKKVVIR